MANYGQDNLLDFLSSVIPGTQLNSLLIEVFRMRSEQLKASDLLKAYANNRFVQPANISPISFKRMELEIMEFLSTKEFDLLEFGPLAPFGSCSVLGTISQNLILSASRGSEVVADITNLMALESAKRKKANTSSQNINLAATHRLTRCQPLTSEKHTAHFKILCLTTAGYDKGNSTFEVQSIAAHINIYLEIFTTILNIQSDQLRVKIFHLTDNNQDKLSSISSRVRPLCKTENIELISIPRTQKIYYQDIQFQINFLCKDQEYFIVDGGFVDWTQQLLQNKKERLMTSGMGTEYLYKVLNS